MKRIKRKRLQKVFKDKLYKQERKIPNKSTHKTIKHHNHYNMLFSAFFSFLTTQFSTVNGKLSMETINVCSVVQGK
jgi:hypothetical protein